MKSNTPKRTNIQERTDRLMRLIEGSAERPPEGADLEVLRKIARLSEEPDFEEEEAYERLTSEIGERNRRARRRRLYFSYAASVAAVILVTLFAAVRLWQKEDFAAKETALSAKAVLPAPDERNVRLTLQNGQIIDVSRDALPGQSADDIKAIEKEMEIGSVSALNTLVVPRGRDYELTLDDGTVLTINSDTQVRFPTEFSGSERRVSVDYGEVFFRVKHDEKHPFIVETGGGEVSVLGTTFNVNAYPEVPVTTTLISGKVGVTKAGKTALLDPGKEAVFGKDGGLEVRTADTAKVLAWMTGQFVFEDYPLSLIAAQLERWYDVELTFEEMALREIRFTGIFEKSYTLDEVLDLITKTSEVEFDTTNASNIRIRKKSTKH